MILAIDIGSNTIKCLLGYAENGVVVRVFEKSLENRILDNGGVLVENASQMIADSIVDFKASAKEFCDDFQVKVVATSALRDSNEREKIVKDVYAKTSYKINVLSGDEEAKLSYCGAMSDPLVDSAKASTYFDLGGGSLEIVAGQNCKVDFACSIPIGAVRLTRSCKTPEEYSEVSRKAISQALVNFPKCDLLVGAGGAVVAGRFIKQKLGLGGEEHKISLENMRVCYQAVLGLSVEQRVEKFAISRNRADIIPSAFASIIELMEFLKIDELTHTFCNIRYGVILSSQ